MKPIELKHLLDETKRRYYAGAATEDELIAVADRYIAAVDAWAKANGKKPPRFKRAALLR